MNDHTESAQMVTQPLPKAKNFINLTGRKFGKYTVISYAGERRWNCLCECGTNKKVLGGHLRSGKIVSCGCYGSSRSFRHGMHEAPEHFAWTNMKARCSNPQHPSFIDYGGRGITVCQRWQDSFEDFFTDMGIRPSKKHSIERRENNFGYGPENCYWGTTKQQGRNKRNTVRLWFNGAHVPLAEVAEIIGVKQCVLRARHQRGWENEEIISGKRNYNHLVKVWLNFNGKRISAKDLAALIGVEYATLRNRKNRGWTDEEAIAGKRKIH